uniref:Uncharacterized protein n=1 Tax=Hemiselmis tepida TaxID=464990 RepID=A0A7S0YRB8_9CRYP
MSELANSKLRDAMRDIRDAGVPTIVNESPSLPPRIPVPPRPKPTSQAPHFTTPRKIVDPSKPVGMGGAFPSKPPLPPVHEATTPAFDKPHPPPSYQSSVRADSVASTSHSVVSYASSTSRYSRHQSPSWAGGAPMPPPKGVLQKMQREMREKEKAQKNI